MNRDMFSEAVISTQKLSSSSIPASRYIASNRFNVREGAGPKFEKRWAERKSRLATLPGFRFFTLLRRVDGPGSDYCDEGGFGNYLSFTVWQDKPSFDVWRTGDAFKEAHGGGGLTGFIQLLSTALFILNGGPKPAFYDGLIPTVSTGLDSQRMEMDGGWRKVAADGGKDNAYYVVYKTCSIAIYMVINLQSENFISPDCYMVQTKFTVPEVHPLSYVPQYANNSNIPFVGQGARL
jgi:heme-degrading monooxygenase HmoA